MAQHGASNEPNDASGIHQGLIYSMGYQVLTIGFMFYMPESITGWIDKEKVELGVMH
jgi:hypothetical protein